MYHMCKSCLLRKRILGDEVGREFKIGSMFSVKPVLLDSVKNYLPLSSHRLNYLKTSFLRDRRSVLLWSGFGLFCLFVFHFLSDGDFSFLLVWSTGKPHS